VRCGIAVSVYIRLTNAARILRSPLRRSPCATGRPPPCTAPVAHREVI